MITALKKADRREYNRAYQHANREAIRRQRRGFYLRNRNEALARAKAYRERDREAFCANVRAKHRSDPAKNLVHAAKRRAIQKGLEFSITSRSVTIPKYCPVLGIPIAVTPRRTSGSSPSIDRLDNSKGYVEGNVVVISHKANAMKQNATLAELESLTHWLRRELYKRIQPAT